ncbi:hypothetical protein N7481_004508 [Penicillium waksmanii]|uniref:uncharacterized protein n=1 Tax=Penicillium waksmanii TaxID=69791 RepID=UPI002548CEE6|nr:uncharacterized protein N7481_004508 [Penicillium waksmanii]KAJ5989298.1 hypothetical protein N7481_004508 [Penicillium waksmanii]
MLHSRVRPLRRPHQATSIASAPAPDFKDNDQNEIEETAEDFFESSIPNLFPDDAPRFGDLEIAVPSYPTQNKAATDEGETATKQNGGADDTGRVQEGRTLFAHFVWSSGLIAAEGIENAHIYATDPTAMGREAYQIWNVTDQSAGLPSLISSLANASTVVATDHPLSPALAGAIQFNIDHNLCNLSPIPPANVSIQPHEWGVLDDPFSQQNRGAFTRIIAADCYWMRGQHENLARTMQCFLAPGGHVCVVAALHTGRATVAHFFETALKNGLRIERIFERDIMAKYDDGREIRREWLPKRDGEGPGTRARWCIICVLRRAEE